MIFLAYFKQSFFLKQNLNRDQENSALTRGTKNDTTDHQGKANQSARR
jgi:hypothetical protein